MKFGQRDRWQWRKDKILFPRSMNEVGTVVDE